MTSNYINSIYHSRSQTEYTVYITQPRNCSQKLWFWPSCDRKKTAL